jgi:HEAT repeat protein
VAAHGARHWATAGRGAGFLLVPLTCAALSGCAGFWDEVTSRDFHFKDAFHKRPDPLWVIQNSTDNDRRRRALESLQEPLQHRGTPEQQDQVLKALTTAALSDPQATCRLAAISTLSHFKDPRAAEALVEAYYRASSFDPEPKHAIHCLALYALGEVRQPVAVDVLVKALRSPPDAGDKGEQDVQWQRDERIAAARALGHYPQYQAAESLVAVLRTEQHDIALRKRANDSLQAITGQDFPADADRWAEYLHQSNDKGGALAGSPGTLDKFIKLISGPD